MCESLEIICNDAVHASSRSPDLELEQSTSRLLNGSNQYFGVDGASRRLALCARKHDR